MKRANSRWLSHFPRYGHFIAKKVTKGHSFLVWYSIDREDQESESVFKLADRMRIMRTNGASKNTDS